MPEGDTVWRAARHLDQTLTGNVLLASDFRVPALATVDLSGERIEGTSARGKHLLTRIGTDHVLHTHLKMEGSWHLYRPSTPWRRPDHQARIVLRTEPWHAVGFSLGVVELLRADDVEQALAYLGPDLLGPDFDVDLAVANLLKDPRPLGVALLDQRNLAGIGNIYRNELCFLMGVHPGAPVSQVRDPRRMVELARSLLHANKERVEQTTTGDMRRGQQTWVYRRSKQRCRRCTTPIRSGQLGDPPAERAIWWCPRCQAAEATTSPSARGKTTGSGSA